LLYFARKNGGVAANPGFQLQSWHRSNWLSGGEPGGRDRSLISWLRSWSLSFYRVDRMLAYGSTKGEQRTRRQNKNEISCSQPVHRHLRGAVGTWLLSRVSIPLKPGALRYEPLKAAYPGGFGAVSHLRRGMLHQLRSSPC
jgi:hypothetical protein